MRHQAHHAHPVLEGLLGGAFWPRRRPGRGPPSELLVTLLWSVQLVLAFTFAMAGVATLLPLEALAVSPPLMSAVPPALVWVVGVAELVGAVALLLPAMTRVLPMVTALGAAGLAALMLLAAGLGVLRGESLWLPLSLFLGALAAFVAWGRWSARPSWRLGPRRSARGRFISRRARPPA